MLSKEIAHIFRIAARVFEDVSCVGKVKDNGITAIDDFAELSEPVTELDILAAPFDKALIKAADAAVNIGTNCVKTAEIVFPVAGWVGGK